MENGPVRKYQTSEKHNNSWVKNLKIEEEETLVSFEVRSLFTSVDLNSAKTTIVELLDSHGPPNGLQRKEDTREKVCLLTYFKFNSQYYEKLRIASMSSITSQFTVEITVQKLERVVLPDVNAKL
ncbi:hypothetical protein CSKR_202981 [Clonorchis sinensis]|uniref:Uncharacterized protein n=1 Tax=Clonorchis sinensis TaxID=79923 RepID=A0A8T1M6L2_CLOSI|nr:hypothetical protein CSKR_202981 [Clonorchis sinensis]